MMVSGGVETRAFPLRLKRSDKVQCKSALEMCREVSRRRCVVL